MLAKIAVSALACCAVLGAGPASAQAGYYYIHPLVYKFVDVAFNDGATLSGQFLFNPTTKKFSDVDLTTTDGLGPNGDVQTGHHYTDLGVSEFYSSEAQGLPYTFFDFVDRVPSTDTHFLNIETLEAATSNGSYALYTDPNVIDANNLLHSGEYLPGTHETTPGDFVGNARGVISGYLSVSGPDPVPETSTAASLGLLLALGLGAVVVKRRHVISR